MNIHALQLSYAAGSTSRDPYGYRTLDSGSHTRWSQLLRIFPSLGRFLNRSGMIVSGYPAALGLAGLCPLVDTYLHSTTFLRAIHLAAIECRPVVFVSQPLSGAEQLLRLCRATIELPPELLWAVGGYYLPVSLEQAVRDWLASCGCRLTCLQAYGVAEIGHTCFAALERMPSGAPCYQQIADEIEVELVGECQNLTLRNAAGKRVVTGDRACRIGEGWQIENQSNRLAPEICQELEQWSPAEWTQRTGYLHAEASGGRWLQRRQQAPESSRPDELAFYEFYARFGGSYLEKPEWFVHVEGDSSGRGCRE